MSERWRRARRPVLGGSNAGTLSSGLRMWGWGAARPKHLCLARSLHSSALRAGALACRVQLLDYNWACRRRRGTSAVWPAHCQKAPRDLAPPPRPPLRYDGLDQTIINASLVPCRPGVFASEGIPTYLLLLSTPSEVRLHAASSEIRPRL